MIPPTSFLAELVLVRTTIRIIFAARPHNDAGIPHNVNYAMRVIQHRQWLAGQPWTLVRNRNCFIGGASLQLEHYGSTTKTSYMDRVSFLLHQRTPDECWHRSQGIGTPGIEAFLMHFAIVGRVSSSIQNGPFALAMDDVIDGDTEACGRRAARARIVS